MPIYHITGYTRLYIKSKKQVTEAGEKAREDAVKRGCSVKDADEVYWQTCFELLASQEKKMKKKVGVEKNKTKKSRAMARNHIGVFCREKKIVEWGKFWQPEKIVG